MWYNNSHECFCFTLLQVLQAQGWEREEKRLKDQVAVQDIRITELEGAIQAISIEVKESKAALNENKEQYAVLDKKYHKAKKLIKDLQEKYVYNLKLRCIFIP